jgi:hypothetical protein
MCHKTTRLARVSDIRKCYFDRIAYLEWIMRKSMVIFAWSIEHDALVN